jgi:hypothetical protein
VIRAIRLAIFLLTVIAACDSPTVRRDARADTYAVYAAVLDSFATRRVVPLRIASRTWPYRLATALGDTSALYRGVEADAGVGPALLGAYDSVNAEAVALCDCFPTEVAVELVAAEAAPGVAGPLQLSRVAFDTTQSRAVVSVGQVCGPLCGSSAVYLVERRGERWQVTRSLLRGVS